MRIVVISTPVFRLTNTGCVGYAGLEHLAWLQAKGLAERGHQVHLVAPDGSQCPGVEVVPIGPEMKVDEKTAFSKYWQLLLQTDCVIDDSWSKFSYTLKMEGRLKVPVLGVLHAPVHTMFKEPPPVEKPCIVCISDDQKAHYEALFGKPARRCWNGVDLAFYKSLNIPRSKRFLFLARFSSVKSPLLNMEIAKEANIGLDLIGDTSITNEPELLQKCQRLADGKQLKLVGGITRGETVWWFSQAYGMLHTCPNFREPFGLSPVESQAIGCPVVAWRFGATSETIIHGSTGYLCTTKQEAIDSVKALVNKSDSEMAKMREACVWNAQRFSVERMVLGYENLCIEACDSGGW